MSEPYSKTQSDKDDKPCKEKTNVIRFPTEKREKAIEKEMMEICKREVSEMDW